MFNNFAWILVWFYPGLNEWDYYKKVRGEVTVSVIGNYGGIFERNEVESGNG